MMMQAMVCRAYGVLEPEQVEVPAIGNDGILVRIQAASLNPLDWHFMTGTPFLGRLMLGLRRPRRMIPGVDLAGTVEAVGRAVTRIRPGDQVFGCAVGSLAEFAAVREGAIVPKPREMSFEQAAAVPIAGLTALQALRDSANLRAGQRVLINGAAGGVGTFAVQIAKLLGAEVTGVCSSANADLVRSIGADHVIDYTREDFARGGERYHVLLDNVVNRSLTDCRRVLRRRGIYVMVGGPKSNPLLPFLVRLVGAAAFMRAGGRKGGPMVARREESDLLALGELLAAGKVVPVIDRAWPLAEAAAAFDHLGRGHARGKLVITL